MLDLTKLKEGDTVFYADIRPGTDFLFFIQQFTIYFCKGGWSEDDKFHVRENCYTIYADDRQMGCIVDGKVGMKNIWSFYHFHSELEALDFLIEESKKEIDFRGKLISKAQEERNKLL